MNFEKFLALRAHLYSLAVAFPCQTLWYLSGLSVNHALISIETYTYHEIIAIFERYRAVKVREEDILWVLEGPIHGFQIRCRSHCVRYAARVDFESQDRDFDKERWLERSRGSCSIFPEIIFDPRSTAFGRHLPEWSKEEGWLQRPMVILLSVLRQHISYVYHHLQILAHTSHTSALPLAPHTTPLSLQPS